MITVIEQNKTDGITIIGENVGNTTILEDVKTGEITEIEALNLPQTTIDRVEHTVTQVESNATLIINNPITNEIADISANNATYLYFGFSFAGWKIRRVLRADGTDGIANSGNNAYSDLSSAWASRETLNYA